MISNAFQGLFGPVKPRRDCCVQEGEAKGAFHGTPAAVHTAHLARPLDLAFSSLQSPPTTTSRQRCRCAMLIDLLTDRLCRSRLPNRSGGRMRRHCRSSVTSLKPRFRRKNLNLLQISGAILPYGIADTPMGIRGYDHRGVNATEMIMPQTNP